MFEIYTAQYRYRNHDRFDITVKSSYGHAKKFAPTWDMVMGIKNNTMSQEEYTKQYKQILNNLDIKWVKEYIVSVGAYGGITLVCFCPKGSFCHRYILAEWLEQNGIGKYMGEREL